MSTPVARLRAKPTRKTYKPGSSRADWGGYRRWVQHIEEFTSYVQDDADAKIDHLYSEWDKNGHVLLSEALEGDLSELPALGLFYAAFPGAAEPQEIPGYLYALEVDDLLDFTTEDLKLAWQLRSQCCGSIEAAAELLALVRVLNEEDEVYLGAAAYLDHPDVVGIFAVSVNQEPAVQAEHLIVEAANDSEPADTSEPPSLALAHIGELTIDELKSAWANRPESFASLEAAAETLAILRSLNAHAPEKPSYLRMLQHELIIELEDSLPLENLAPAPSPAIELALLKADRRTVRTQTTVIRPGQGNFRAAMLERYGGACCISGCRVDTLLEAAHIIPYRGDHSDDVTNGLLLRVDLHRLFDAHLVTIDPATFTVVVASTVDDPVYQGFHGKRLFSFSPKPRVLFIEAHHQAFMKT